MAMAVPRTMNLLLLLQVATFGLCYGTVYKVGDSDGWTNKDCAFYQNWASSKNFKVGDTLVFQYNPEQDNVVRVSRGEFHSCDIKEPMLVYVSGNDSVAIKSSGHHYYVSGSHCKSGQKVDIRVLPMRHQHGAASPAPSPSVFGAYAPTPCIAGSLFCHPSTLPSNAPPASSAASTLPSSNAPLFLRAVCGFASVLVLLGYFSF